MPTSLAETGWLFFEIPHSILPFHSGSSTRCRAMFSKPSGMAKDYLCFVVKNLRIFGTRGPRLPRFMLLGNERAPPPAWWIFWCWLVYCKGMVTSQNLSSNSLTVTRTSSQSESRLRNSPRRSRLTLDVLLLTSPLLLRNSSMQST